MGVLYFFSQIFSDKKILDYFVRGAVYWRKLGSAMLWTILRSGGNTVACVVSFTYFGIIDWRLLNKQIKECGEQFPCTGIGSRAARHHLLETMPRIITMVIATRILEVKLLGNFRPVAAVPKESQVVFERLSKPTEIRTGWLTLRHFFKTKRRQMTFLPRWLKMRGKVVCSIFPEGTWSMVKRINPTRST